MQVVLDLSDVRAPELMKMVALKNPKLDLEQVQTLTTYLDNVPDMEEPLPVQTDKFFEIRLYKSTLYSWTIFALPVDLRDGPEYVYVAEGEVDPNNAHLSRLIREYVASTPDCGIDLTKFRQ